MIEATSKYTKKVLKFLAIMTIIFIAVCFVMIWFKRTIPDALIVSYFAAITGEAGILGVIKIKDPIKKIVKKLQNKAKK